MAARHDAVLRGAPGTIVRARTPDGRRVLRDDPPLAGTDLTVELDMDLQTLSEDSLTRWYELAEALGTATDKMKAGLSVGKGRAASRARARRSQPSTTKRASA